MYLVDTSAWIGFLRGADTAVVNRLRQLLQHGETVGLTAIIYQEILQGAESIQRFEQFRDYFGSQRFYHPLDNKESYVEAARLYFSCRRQGITIRSTVDCLIARIAIEHDLLLLHQDRDFEQLAQVIPELKLA